MSDESTEEFASLYIFGLLEGLELAAFEARLARDAGLRDLVRDLTEASAQLAHTAPAAEPPAALKARILAQLGKPIAARSPPPAEVVEFPRINWMPWAAAAALAIGCAWLGQLYLSARSENVLLHDQQALADFELKSARHQLEAERLIARQEVGTATDQLTSNEKNLALARRQADDARTQLGTLQRQLAVETQRIADLQARAKSEGNLANFKIATLASLLGNSPQALAVAVWNPARQEGVLRVEKLPALAEGQDYQLWLVDPQYPIPVDGGVFTVDPETGEARVNFKADKPIKTVAKFAVSLERKGGVPKAEGPMVLLSQ
ncbi:MAG: hypothetical protein JWM32_1665 [Verrucomicrobia bacterium]|nr:hypothetical protein [Verrucomicrobiota bacterium]